MPRNIGPTKNLKPDNILALLLEHCFFISGGGHIHYCFDEGTYINSIMGDEFEALLSKYLRGDNLKEYMKYHGGD